MIDRPAGAVNAALAPVAKRAVTSSVGLSARPATVQAAVKATREARKTRLRPYRSATRPPSSSRLPNPRV